MRIWNHIPNIVFLNQIGEDSMPGHLGIEIIEVGDDFIRAKMPVNKGTKQPMGLLHGGASAALSETIGSTASMMTLADPDKETIVGVEINANHLRSARDGYVYSMTKPVKLGKRLQVWNTDIYDENDRHLCTSRLTTMVVKKQ